MARRPRQSADRRRESDREIPAANLTGNLEIEITVDDPKAYTKPWTVKVNQRVMLNTELIEFICEDRDATHYVGAESERRRGAQL